MTDANEPESTVEALVGALGGLLTRLPVTDTVKATRAAAEITATVVRQGQSVLELHSENARLREALAAATAREVEQQRRVEAAEAQTATLRQVVRLLTGPEPDHSEG